MKRILFLLALLFGPAALRLRSGPAVSAVEPAAAIGGAETHDQRIGRWLSEIDRASEKGDFGHVQELRLKLAEFAAGIGRYDFAARHYELLLAARPRRSERVKLFVRLGTMRTALGDYSRAIGAFSDALHDDPKDWEANLSRARAFAATEINSQAIEAYQRCIRLRPKDPAPYEEIARVYQRQGFPGKAIAFYEKALAIQPKPEIYLGIADAYVHQDDLAQATQILRQAKTFLPRAEYDVRLGDIYRRQGELARAGAAWEEALKTDPKRDDVRLKLALLYDRLHRRSDADRLFRHLLAAYPQSPLVRHLRALILWERGDRSASRSEALAVERLSPTELVRHYNNRLLAVLQK